MLWTTRTFIIVVLLLSGCEQASTPLPKAACGGYLCTLGSAYGCQSPDDFRLLAFFSTKLGNFTLEVLPHAAPQTAHNFIQYLEANYFEGTLIHKTNENFIIRTGRYNMDYQPKLPIFPPIKNEANPYIEHRRGTVAMVRYHHPDSATSEFLINLQDNPLLSITKGYTVFAIIREGMEIIDKIADAESTDNPIKIETTALISVPCDIASYE